MAKNVLWRDGGDAQRRCHLSVVYVPPLCVCVCEKERERASEMERGMIARWGKREGERERKRATAADGADITAARGRKRRSTTGRTRDNEPASRCSSASERAKRESGNAAYARPYVTLTALSRGIYPADSFSPSRGRPLRDEVTLRADAEKRMRESWDFSFTDVRNADRYEQVKWGRRGMTGRFYPFPFHPISFTEGFFFRRE